MFSIVQIAAALDIMVVGRGGTPPQSSACRGGDSSWLALNFLWEAREVILVNFSQKKSFSCTYLALLLAGWSIKKLLRFLLQCVSGFGGSGRLGNELSVWDSKVSIFIRQSELLSFDDF